MNLLKLMRSIEFALVVMFGLIFAITGVVWFYFGSFIYGFYSYFLAVISIIILKLMALEQELRKIGGQRK